ncbi:MAG: hypothetical protein EA420_03415 [Candidatus Competibacteraceae bacterium]|nr:MAG: hypothetical protein EA420_03415 [Candidatus Competibacteraceae bacterium]
MPFLPDATLTTGFGKWRLEVGDGRVRETDVASYITVDMLELLWDARPFPPVQRQWRQKQDRLAWPTHNLTATRRHLHRLGLWCNDTMGAIGKWLQHMPTVAAKCPVCHGPDAPTQFRFSPPHGWVAGPGYQLRLSPKKAKMLEILTTHEGSIATDEWQRRTQRAFGHHIRAFQTEISQLNQDLERTPVRLVSSRGYWQLAHGFSVPEPLWRQAS